jgi:hypothetical protein
MTNSESFCRQQDAYADRAVFYKMLRPEIVKEFHVPLSSDAFTGTHHQDHIPALTAGLFARSESPLRFSGRTELARL